jgi:hypothetical protein
VAAELRKEPGVDVAMVDGSKGEFTVSVDGHEVARKSGDAMPSAEEVLASVRRSEPAHVGPTA